MTFGQDQGMRGGQGMSQRQGAGMGGGGQFQNPAAQWLFANMLRQQAAPGLRPMPGQQPQIPYGSLQSILYGPQGGGPQMDQRARGRFDPSFGIQQGPMGL